MKPKQADILRHASALFNREGYQSPSIERIAEHAGISKMTFYRYYADKEALILAILKQKRANLCRIWRRSRRIKPARGKSCLPCSTTTIAGLSATRSTAACLPARCLNMARHRRRSGSSAPIQVAPLAVLPRYPPAGVKTGTCRAGRHDDGDAHRWRYRRSAGRVRRMPGDPTGDHRLERSQSAYLLRRRNAVR